MEKPEKERSQTWLKIGICIICLLCAASLVVTVVVLVNLNGISSTNNEKDGHVENGGNGGKNDNKPAECVDIAIVGGGAAGTYAAWRLREKGLNIHLFEQQDRLGGRLYSIDVPGLSMKAEMGAMRITNNHVLFNKTIHDIGLTVQDFVTVGAKERFYYLRNTHLLQEDFEIPEKMPYNLGPEEQGLYRRDLTGLLQNRAINISTRTDPYKTMTIDGRYVYQTGFLNLLMEYGNAEVVNYLKDGGGFHSIFDVNKNSANSVFMIPLGNGPDAHPTYRTISEGFQEFPKTLAERFLAASNKHRIFMNHRLESMSSSTYDNTLTFKDLLTGKTKSVCARKVFLALPKLALERLIWAEKDNQPLKDYLISVNDVTAVKILFAYDRPWWRREGNGEMFDRLRSDGINPEMVITDSPLRIIQEMGVEIDANGTEGKSLLLACYADMSFGNFWQMLYRKGTPFADGLDAQIPITEEVVHYTNKFLSQVFNISLEELPQPYAAVMQSWGEFPHGAAWHTWRAGYKYGDVSKGILKPVKDQEVYIVGEAYSMTQSWVEGALQTVDQVLNEHFNK